MDLITNIAIIAGYIVIFIIIAAIIVAILAAIKTSFIEVTGFIRSRKWRKNLMNKMKLETARDCANYLSKFSIPHHDVHIQEIREYFNNKILKEKDGKSRSDTSN